MLQTFLKKIIERKIIAVIVIIILIGAGYYGYKALKGKTNATHYVTATVEKGTIVTSMSGSGQVAALDQADIKSKVSGDVIYVGAANGIVVKKGALLTQLDKTDAEKTVEDAKISLQQQQLAFDKMKGMTTENGTIRGTKEKATNNLDKAYEDGFNDVSNIFLDLPNIMTGLQDMIFSYNLSANQWNIDFYASAISIYDEKSLQYRDDAYNKYRNARTAYDQNFEDYKSATSSSGKETIDSLINQTYETVGEINDAVKSANNLIRFYQDELTKRGLKPVTLSSTHLATLNSYVGETNGYLSSLFSAKNTIQNDKETLIETDFDIADQEIQVKKMEDALNDAQNKLADYSIYSPFAGMITKVDVEKGDSISANSTIATIITEKQIANISLNEIDAAKVKTGQKTTLTFDAVEGLSITGKVLEMDMLGTVSQGVVSYNVKIGFDTQDERVKPGMSVSAAIITDTKQDVLLVSNSAIKSSGDTNYVEILDETTSSDKISASIADSAGVTSKILPRQQTVETGLSNDSVTEVINGLKEGDKVVTQTITANTSQSQTQQSSSLRIPGISGGFGR